MEPARRTIGIVGCGAVGRALALALGGRGLLVSLWSRTRARAEELAADVGQGAAGRAEVVGFEELGRAEGVILSVHDDALSEVARELSCIEPLPACVLHTCGYHGTGVLEPLRREGVSCGKLHPLLSLPSDPPEAPGEERLFGGVFGVGGDAPALELACELVGRLGGREIVLRPGEEYDRLYHAAASLLSGGYVALVSAAVERLYAQLIDDYRDAIAELSPDVDLVDACIDALWRLCRPRMAARGSRLGGACPACTTART